MSRNECKEYYDFITEVVHCAGQIVTDGFHSPKEVQAKDGIPYNLVTKTDKLVQEYITKNIHERYPHHLIIGEETTPSRTTPTLTDAHTWIIDPIDGTINFINAIPMIAISVALAVKKEVVVGIVYNPMTNQFYSSIKGSGAYCNGKKITASTNTDLHKTIVSNELSLASLSSLRERTLKRVTRLVEFGVLGFRCLGSAAISICYVADGSLGVYFTEGLQCWDVAAAVLILQEAGGCVCNPDGGKFDMFSGAVLTAGNQTLLDKVIEILS